MKILITGWMKSLAIIFAAFGSLSSGFGADTVDGGLPAHSLWVEVGFGDFKFQVSMVEVSLTSADIANPPPKDFSKLVNCATWYVHYGQHARNIEGLRSLLESSDRFHEGDHLERLIQNLRSGSGRSYTHLIRYEGFHFLLGTQRTKDGSSSRVIGVYRWDDEQNQFFPILETPAFTKVSGPEFRSALYEIDLGGEAPEAGLQAPVPKIDRFEKKETKAEDSEQPDRSESKSPSGFDSVFRNGIAEDSGGMLRYDELLSLIISREIESVTIDRDLSIAMAHPKKDSRILREERLVSLPYWSYRDSPDFALRQMCQTYGVALIIAAKKDAAERVDKTSPFQSFGFWALVISVANFFLLLALINKNRSLK